MALFQPTNVYPSTFAGVGGGTIDATQTLTVTWQVNGNTPMLAYRIVICQNDAASTQLLTTGKVVLDEPFYGVNYAGAVQYFSATPITAAEMASAGIVNGYVNGYKLIITQWWGATDAESIAQSSASAFITRDTPTVSIDAFSTPLSGRTATFTATYTQAQGDALNWVRWEILDANSDALVQTGNISGTAQLRVSYDGFYPGEGYTIQCTAETQNGIQATSGAQPFSVAYPLSDPSGTLLAMQDKRRSCVAVAWDALRVINGEATGGYALGDGSITLNDGARVLWDSESGAPLRISAPWTLAWKGVLPGGVGGDVLEIDTSSGTMVLRADENGTTLTLGGTTIATVATDGTLTDWVAAVVTPTEIHARRVLESGGAYPSATLYPSASRYPQGSTARQTITGSADFPITFSQGDITAVRLLGMQVCDYLWITGDTPTAAEVNSILTNADFAPDWTANTRFLAAFEATLNAGNTEMEGYSLYRREGDGTGLTHILDTGLDMASMLDFSAKSQTPYTYYLFNRSSNAYTSEPLTSARITPVFWAWTVLECREDENGAMRILREYPFALNVESGDVSNNNTPALLHNFTPYPLRQSVNQNYLSGTLKAYIGVARNNCYEDSIALSEQIRALSVSRNPKFLKDRKGNLLRIETSAAITMTVRDVSAAQPYMMALPWAEVGSAAGVSIVATSTDGIWPDDRIVDSSLHIDTATGRLTWTLPDDYVALENGSVLAVSLAGQMTQETSAWFNPAVLAITDAQALTAT